MARGFRFITGSPVLLPLHMNRLMIRLAVRQPIRWLMCGDFVNLQSLIYGIAQRDGENYHAILKNILIARAETCYQVVALLRKTKATCVPTFISDLLLHFYTDDIHTSEVKRLFAESLRALNQISQEGPVIVSASGRMENPQLHHLLCQNAGRVTRLGGDACHGS